MADSPETTPQTEQATTPAEGMQEAAHEVDTGQNNDSETNTQHPENKKEIGGRGGLDPARYGDWEVNGRCYDF